MTSSRFTGRLPLVVLACAALTTLSIGFAGSAQAHSGLDSSSPADGSIITEAPASIVLTFSEELLPGADSVSLNAADGTNVVSANVQPDGSSVELPWPADLPAGDYQAAFRVVSADGHPVTGAISFTYAPSETASAPAASGPAVSEAATAESSASPAVVEEQVTDTTEPESTGGTPWLGLGIAVAIGLALVVLFAAIRRRRA
jgi:methionine-rich copper-binding protein CopC